MDVIERSKYWKNKVNEKIQIQRQSMEGKDLESCTFRPQLGKVLNSIFKKLSFVKENIKHSHSSNELLNPPTNFNKMGIIQHFERIDQAKRKKVQKEGLLNKFNGFSFVFEFIKK